MISPQQGMAFMQQMQQLQRPGGAGIGAPPALGPDGKPSPTQGLIARMMSDNPGGLLGALMKQGGNAPVNPGAAPAVGDPAFVPGGQGPMAGGAAPGGMGFMDMMKGGGGMGMLGGLMSKFGGGAGGMPQISQREDLRPGWGTQVPPGAVEDPIWPSKY